MNRIAIRNNQQEIIGYVVDYGPRQEVRDKHGDLVGWVANGQTRDKYGDIVSWQPNAGLLFGNLW